MSKSSEKRLWFRAKNYGYGWYPVTWEGWTVIIIYVLFITYRGAAVSKMFDTESSFALKYSFEILFATIPLILISYLKGEKASWRWGKKK